MTVIIPHPTEELKIIKYQKELIRTINNNSTTYYAHQQIWIVLPENYSPSSKTELKNLGKTIKKIKIESPIYTIDKIELPAEVVFENNKSIIINFPLLHLYKKNGSESSTPSLPSCPVSELKIFRLALSTKLSENSQALTDFIWVKK